MLAVLDEEQKVQNATWNLQVKQYEERELILSEQFVQLTNLKAAF